MSRVCIKVDNLRKLTDDKSMTLRKWLENDNNIYVGRALVYVDGANNSKWHNPYTVKKYGREQCLTLYKKYIMAKLANNELSLDELNGKILGCWCATDEDCHADILIQLME